jgi:predicted aconitase with swiveling domain
MARGRPLVPGSAHGRALVLDEPLSFWGGFDPASGRIVDRRHPQRGERVTGRILVMPSGRGSSSSSSVLAEAARAGTGPAAILLLAADDIVALGLLVAEELYGVTAPVVVLEEPDYRALRTGDDLTVGPDGTVGPRARASG